jgi:Domain of unknown function (DUF5753)/Domain of unknown function (DUF397)
VATGAPLDEIIELAERTRSGTPEWFMPYKRAEAEAHTLRCWQPTVFPGLLQCESYARTLFDRGGYALSRIDELVAARMERQAIIGQTHITAIIDQHVLARLVGPPGIMAEQCAYVAGMAGRRDITLHVVPDGVNIGTGGGLDIAVHNHGTTICLATGLDDVTSTAPDVVAKATVPRVDRTHTNGGRDMEDTDLTWRKASKSENGGASCVEVGTTAAGRAAGIRDSKSPERGHLAVTPEVFRALVARIKRGEL